MLLRWGLVSARIGRPERAVIGPVSRRYRRRPILACVSQKAGWCSSLRSQGRWRFAAFYRQLERHSSNPMRLNGHRVGVTNATSCARSTATQTIS